MVQKINLRKHKHLCEKHDYCCVEMRKEYNNGEKYMKVPFIIQI